MKKNLSVMMEWIRLTGICVVFYLAYYFGNDPGEILHIMGPFIVILMAGTISLESLLLVETASAKIGYKPNRAYQIQSALNNLATAITAVLVFVLDWGKYADATILTVYLLFQLLSGFNHARSILAEKNYTKTNLLRPVLSLILVAVLIPHLVAALK